MHSSLLTCCFVATLSLASALAHAQRAPAVAATPPACSDFYSHANADWLRQNLLPTGTESISRWQQLDQLAKRQFDAVLTAPTANQGPASALLANLAASALDEALVETSGQTLMQSLYAPITGLRRNRDLPTLLASLDARGLSPLFSLTAEPAGALTLQPQGLGLPGPDFYTSAEPAVRRVDDLYRAYIAEMLRLAGTEPSTLAQQSAWVMAIELELAKARQAGSQQPRQTLADKPARKAYSHLPLEALRKERSLTNPQWTFDNPTYFQTLQRLIDKTPIEHWKAYLRAHVGHALAPALGKAYREPHERLFVGYLAGQPMSSSRAEWLLQFAHEAMPGVLDAAYQERYLPAARRERAKELAESMRHALIGAIDRANWLSAEGKASARTRAEALRFEIAQEPVGTRYAGLTFARDQLATNVLALRVWQRNQPAASSSAWPVPQWQPMVLLMPGESRLLVTAALLQPPVLGDTAGPGDYGSFAALVGQQLGHAFQTWNGADATAWQARSAPLIGQYNAFPATPGIKVNGVRSATQNQADLVALELAHTALLASGSSDTAAQRAFFAAWASLWPRRDSDRAVLASVSTGQHAPAKWRVNGPLMNLPAFTQAFACKGRDAMLRPAKDQIALWR